MRRVVAVLALVLFAACNSLASEIESFSVEGTWRGAVSGQTLIMTLQQSGQTLAGSGTLASPGAPTRNLSISGNYAKPTFTATLQSAGEPSLSLEGIVEGDSFVGNLTGGAFTGTAIAMRRD